MATLKNRGVMFQSDPHHIGDLGDAALWMAFFQDRGGNLLALQSERQIG
ncbi:hypothetical protein [Sulfobacillus harzensis]|uniref:Uncharacterized protein n=1 Tax=Sulfobacillus harzensis TaxID=2729629 RepID=A0A7Y0Q3V5_9FIRM|nr:hypothetical protein [Sulfobacillus harzensis]NMP23765.1 hypothetical protein [Sulfobacillus harzensis]